MHRYSLVHASMIAAVAIAAVIIGQSAPAKAQSSGATTSETPRHSRSVRPGRDGFVRHDNADNIVCLKGGCRPLPPHCHAETEFDREGGPTGYQYIVCP